MINDDRLGAALGLGAFARIVDDKRIKMGQGAEGRLRKAVLAERQRLAGQPFQIAVFAEMDNGMGGEASA